MVITIAYIIICTILVFALLVVIDTIKQVRKEDARIKRITDALNKKKDADSNTNTK